MGSLSIWHWLIVLAVVLVLFGGSSKISNLMGDFAKGIKSFKKNMGDDESMEHDRAAASGQGAPPPPLVGQQPSPGFGHEGYPQAPQAGAVPGQTYSAPYPPPPAGRPG